MEGRQSALLFLYSSRDFLTPVDNLSHHCRETRDVLSHFWEKTVRWPKFDTNVSFDGFLWSSPTTCVPICSPPRGRGGELTNWEARGRFPIVWLRRRRRPRDTVQIAIFVGGRKLLETIQAAEWKGKCSNSVAASALCCPFFRQFG